ncbi:MAG: lipid-A-disaccharide synthase [Bacteroidota bacterium]
MRYYIIAGEKSGDRYGARLIQALQREDPTAVCRCWGGKHMQQAADTGAVPPYHLAVMGLDFLAFCSTYYQHLRFCKKDLLRFRPDVVILIDYSGFNLRIAPFAKKQGITTVYYVAPKVWAWRPGRIRKLSACVDRLFSILPFEPDFYKRHTDTLRVDYVGNPLVEELALYQPDGEFWTHHKLDSRPMIALLPGSRMQEVTRILPTMLAVAAQLTAYQFVVAAINDMPADLYAVATRMPHVHIVYDQPYDVLTNAYVAVVAAGTATLEAALLGIPQVVVYKTHGLTYWLAKRLVQLRYISLVNILAGRRVVPELIQQDYQAQSLQEDLHSLLSCTAVREQQLHGYRYVKGLLGNRQAAQQVAQMTVAHLKTLGHTVYPHEITGHIDNPTTHTNTQYEAKKHQK